MRRILLPRLTCTLRLLGAILAAGTTATHAAFGEPPSMRPLPQGHWPKGPQGGIASDVKGLGRYAYLADYVAGLEVIDISKPTHLVRVGGYTTSDGITTDRAHSVVVSGNYAYVAAEDEIQDASARMPSGQLGGSDSGLSRC